MTINVFKWNSLHTFVHAVMLINKMHDASSLVFNILSPCVQRAPSMLINSFSGHCEHVTGEVEQREICEVAIVRVSLSVRGAMSDAHNKINLGAHTGQHAHTPAERKIMWSSLSAPDNTSTRRSVFY